MIRAFEARGVTTVVLPCFLSHTFIDELKANTRLPIVDIVEAVLSHVQRKYPDATRIGVLASDYVRENGSSMRISRRRHSTSSIRVRTMASIS